MNGRLPTYFLSHGGGPWPFTEGPFRRQFDKLEESMVAIRNELDGAPKAILVISGHWENAELAVSSSPQPGMLFDYYGFPKEMYEISYPAPGSPALAARVQALLAAGGVPCHADAARGFDHGTFSMMKPLYPDADIPVVQLSMKIGYDPLFHLQIGQLLAPLRDEGVLILGSGGSYHNLRRIDPTGVIPSRAFDNWLNETLVAADPAIRWARLVEWTRAPHARDAHPREEHLIPLMVAVGAAKDEPGKRVYNQIDFMAYIATSSFRFGAPVGQ